MNAFADLLLSVLLGWMKGLTQLLWTFFADGGSNGFLAWLGDHWMMLVAILCLAGVSADFAAWLQQRRLAKKTARSAEKHPNVSGEETPWGFEQPFGDSMDMEGLAVQEESEPLTEENNQPVFPHVERKPVRENAEKTFFPVRAAWEPRTEEDNDGGDLPDPVTENAVPAERRPAAEAPARRRRSDKHEGRERKRLFPRVAPLIQSDEQESGMLDGLPPVIDKNEAFHKPVYPK